MMNKDLENQRMQEQLNAKETGVAELVELYSKIEIAYSSCTQALMDPGLDYTTNSTNWRAV